MVGGAFYDRAVVEATRVPETYRIPPHKVSPSAWMACMAPERSQANPWATLVCGSGKRFLPSHFHSFETQATTMMNCRSHVRDPVFYRMSYGVPTERSAASPTELLFLPFFLDPSVFDRYPLRIHLHTAYTNIRMGFFTPYSSRSPLCNLSRYKLY